MRRPALLLSLLFLIPASANAQVSFRGFGDAGVTVFTATQSFKAILGKPSGPVYGGGIEIGESHLFLSIGARRFRRTGHRVFVLENQIFPLNVKDTITVTPLDLTFGYRFTSPTAAARLRRAPRFVPYAGGGIGWYGYQERSDHATDAENVKNTHTGYHLVAGAEVPLRSWLSAAVDAQWAAVPNALGDSASSVAKVYDEHDLGGFTLRAKIIVGR
jgi:Outer membrane protein beta-barrel domain